MRIGAVARRVGVATSAVRFYEEQGLIPEPPRTPAGYRDFDPAVIERLEFIKAGQAVGLTLSDLRQVLRIRDDGRPPCRHVAELIDERIDDVDRRIGDLRRLRGDLVALQRRGADLDPADCPPEGVCRILSAPG